MGQVLYPPAAFAIPLPPTIAGSGNWSSGLMFNDGYRYVTIALTSSQAGLLTLQTYLDLAGTIPRPQTPTAIVAATLLILDLADLKPFVSYTITVSNSSGTPAVVSVLQVVLSAG